MKGCFINIHIGTEYMAAYIIGYVPSGHADRTQRVVHDGTASITVPVVSCRCPTVSVLAPRCQFSVYINDLPDYVKLDFLLTIVLCTLQNSINYDDTLLIQHSLQMRSHDWLMNFNASINVSYSMSIINTRNSISAIPVYILF